MNDRNDVNDVNDGDDEIFITLHYTVNRQL